ncbi:MAG: AI-2 transport protein TqsA [Saprospiraceae bacterium]|jgi:AI-2 transport protein TqsA
MLKEASFSTVGRALMISAAVIIILSGMKAASGLIAPFLMAIFVAIVCSPSLNYLRDKGVPNTIALCIVLLAIGLMGAMLATWLSGSLTELSATLPGYKVKLTILYQQLREWLTGWNIALPEPRLLSVLSPDSLVSMFNRLLNGLSGVLGNALIVFIAVLFLLVDSVRFPEKLKGVLENPDKSMPHFKHFTETVVGYLALKSVASGITALCVAAMLWFFDFDFIALWTVLAFFLNFIPYLGSAIAAIAPIFIGVIDHSLWVAVSVAVGYIAINILVGQIIETRLIGNKLNLSSFVVFVSLTFWGWILGPVGMFLSIPLTMLVLIALQSSEKTKRYAALLQG